MKKSERLNQELIFLSDKTSFHLKDLMEEFQISKRTALRDIGELELLGLPLYTESGRYGGYKIINQNLVVPIYFSKEEIEAIFFALKALTLLSSTPFEKSYIHIRQKLLATIPKTQQKQISELLEVIDYHSVPPINNINELSLILRSIIEEQVLTLTDEQHDNKIVQLQILELFYRNGIWFCGGYDLENNEWGIYRCDYLTNISVNVNITKTYSKAELKEFQLEHENTFNNIPFRCKLTTFGKELFLKNNYPNMKLEIENDTPYIIGGYNQDELAYMTHYLISFGKNVIVEYPEQLRNNVKADLQSIIENYE